MFHKAIHHITTDSIDLPIQGIQMSEAMRIIERLSGPRTPRTQSVSAGVPWIASGVDFVEYRPPVLSSLRIGRYFNDYLQLDQ
jgi:hypothetical protein